MPVTGSTTEVSFLVLLDISNEQGHRNKKDRKGEQKEVKGEEGTRKGEGGEGERLQKDTTIIEYPSKNNQ